MATALAPDRGGDGAAIPRPQAADAAWVEALLQGGGHDVAVQGIRVEPVGSGQLGETVRFCIDYAAGEGPGSVIGKFASADATSRAVAAMWSLYAREVRFYRELAPAARIALPLCYGGRLGADGDFVLLLEDLAPARAGDQFAGLTEAAAERAVREAARLHAAFPHADADPALAWLDTAAKGQPFYTADIFRGAWPAFVDRYGERLSDDHRRVCDALCERYEAYDRAPAGPRCVTHNDYRPDNMLFRADGSLVAVDWQSIALGAGAVDVAYLIGGSYAPADRRAIEPALITAYRDELDLQGAGEPAGFAEDYRRSSFAGINVAVGAAMLVQRTERGDRMFLTMLDRHVAHVLDQGALSLLHE